MWYTLPGGMQIVEFKTDLIFQGDFMSREQIVNEKYTLAFGVDHVCGPFVQVWEKREPETENEKELHGTGIPAIYCDRMTGLQINNPNALERNFKLKKWTKQIEMNVKLAELMKVRPHLGEGHVIQLGHALEIKGDGFERKVFELWD